MSSELKVDKVSPATGTSTTLGDSGDTFTVPSGVTLDTSSSTLTLPSSAITGQTAITSLADTDKFLVSDASDSGNLKYVENQYIGGGALVKVGDVQSNAAAGSHDLTGIFSDTYDKYFFSLSTFPVTAGQYLYMQFLDSSNSPLTSGYYGAAYGLKQNGTEVRHNDGGTSAAKLNESTSSGRAWQGQGYIVGPTSGIANNKGISWQSVFYDGSDDQITQTGGYTNTLSTDATGMRIYSGVNLAAISLQVYGVVDTKNYNG